MRVTFVRGRRVVRGVDSSSSSSSDAVVRGVDVSLLDVSDEDVGDVLDGLMSDVTGGLVLVMVWVVVGLDVLVAVAENDGST